MCSIYNLTVVHVYNASYLRRWLQRTVIHFFIHYKCLLLHKKIFVVIVKRVLKMQLDIDMNPAANTSIMTFRPTLTHGFL